MIDKETATAIVSLYLKGESDDRIELMVREDRIIRNEHGWVFSYDSKKAILEQNRRYSVAGNYPIFIFEESARMYTIYPGVNLEEIINIHRKDVEENKPKNLGVKLKNQLEIERGNEAEPISMKDTDKGEREVKHPGQNLKLGQNSDTNGNQAEIEDKSYAA